MPFVQMLRAATAVDHQRVDDRFGGFALDDVADYRCFLLAHARALPAVEAVLTADGDDLPPWRPRTSLLADDLARLDASMPAPLPFVAQDAARWGALYVIEGSRLGGQLLARSVPAGSPAAYLSARHASGEWRSLLQTLDARAERAHDAWRDEALAGARATFDLYASAADRQALRSPRSARS